MDIARVGARPPCPYLTKSKQTIKLTYFSLLALGGVRIRQAEQARLDQITAAKDVEAREMARRDKFYAR
jgi:hypothetical protein